jgi:hypothetical protein
MSSDVRCLVATLGIEKSTSCKRSEEACPCIGREQGGYRAEPL